MRITKYYSFILVFLFTVFTFIQVTSKEPQREPVSKKQKRVACIGNSITYGMTLNDRKNTCYPAMLQNFLGENYEVKNFGKNGATLLRDGHRPYFSQEEYTQAIDYAGDIVVIHLGVNDTDPRDFPDYGDNFVKDYISLIDSLKKTNPSVRIILANLSPLHSKHYRFKSGTRAWRDSIRNLIPIIADVTGAELIDFGKALEDYPNLFPDGIHPNEEGASILAETVYNAITGEYGGLKLPEIYGDGMVLQRYKPLRIKGMSNPGRKINIRIGDRTVTSESNSNGEWEVIFPPLKEDIGLTMTISDGVNEITYNDIAVGEVWIASGQSNMEFQMGRTETGKQDLLLADDSLLRFFDMKSIAVTDNHKWTEKEIKATNHLDFFSKTQWKESTPQTAKDFSAIAYHYGKMLRDSLNVPIGIISIAVGGSPIESWIDITSLKHEIPEILVDWQKNDYLMPWVQNRIKENVGEMTEKNYNRHPFEPSYLFSSGIRPLGGYPMAGVIWYQGESNAHNIEIHERLFPLMIESWRKEWKEPELPFIFVQLSSINRPSWPKFRDSQRRLADRLRNVYMVVSSDHGDSLDVHPKNKKPIGERLARQSLNHVYSKTNITPEGPKIKEAILKEPNSIVLSFDFSSGLKTSDGKAPKTFEIAEFDGLYEPAETIEIINNNEILLQTSKIKHPKLIRYGWQPFTRANLINGDSLPTSTFKIEVKNNKLNMEEGINSGVSGAYVGSLKGNLIQAGGCNFPINPMAPDSKKKFYRGIYSIIPNETGEYIFQQIGELPEEMAYGVGVTTPYGIFFIGGTTPEKSLSTVSLCSFVNDGKISVEAYPSLPGTIDNFAATYFDNKLFVGGGNFNGKPSNKFFVFDLTNISKGWEELPSFPGNPRVQPIMAGGENSKGMKGIYLWGGFAGKSNERDATLNTDGHVFDLIKNKWRQLPAPKDKYGEDVSTGGSAVTVLPDGRIVVIGGVNKNIFLSALQNQAPDYLSHPIDWYRFNDSILVFDPKTENWSVARIDKRVARAGAGVISTPNNEIIITGGELKPRIRTSEVLKIKID